METEKERLEDKIDHVTRLVDLEWNGQITRSELVKRLTDIVKKDKKMKKAIQIDGIEGWYYVEDDTLIYGADDVEGGVEVSDLTELRVWQYDRLVCRLNEQYPDYKIEHLIGRFI